MVSMCSAVFGDEMWPASDIRRVKWAILNRTGKVRVVCVGRVGKRKGREGGGRMESSLWLSACGRVQGAEGLPVQAHVRNVHALQRGCLWFTPLAPWGVALGWALQVKLLMERRQCATPQWYLRGEVGALRARAWWHAGCGTWWHAGSGACSARVHAVPQVAFRLACCLLACLCTGAPAAALSLRDGWLWGLASVFFHAEV